MSHQILYDEVGKPVKILFVFDSDIQCLSLSYTYVMTVSLTCILRATLDLVNFERDSYNKVRLECHLHSSFSSLDIQTSLSPPVVLYVTLVRFRKPSSLTIS